VNLHALTGAYVLDALDAEERAAFEAHLPGCPDCRAEVASLREAATAMAVADAVTPPPELRDAVRARIARTPQLPPQVADPTPAPAAGHEPATPAPAGDAPPPPPVPLRRRRSRSSWLASWPVTAAAAAVALVLAIGGTLLVQAQRDDRLAATQAEVMRIVSAPDMVSHDLGLGASHLVMSQDLGAAAVMGDDVPMPDHAGMVYQVWMMHTDGSMAAGPTFMPHDGEVTALVEGDLSDVAAFMVTEEPKGGSPEPTGDYVAELHL
jgi:anti-sigma-K factor RskA